MSFEKRLFDIIGNRMRITREQDGTRISWIRMSGLELVLLFVWGMAAIVGLGSAAGWQRILGLDVPPLNGMVTAAFWTVWALLGAHLFFNRRSTLRINERELTFRRRPLTFRFYRYPTAAIREISTRATSQFYENDTGFYPDIAHFYILFDGGKRLRLDSFNAEDCEKLKGTIESFR